MCPRSADWEDLEKATIEGVQTLASEHSQVEFCKRYIPLYLAFDGSFKNAAGKAKGNNTQVTGSLLFQWKATMKMAMSKNYRYFQEETQHNQRCVPTTLFGNDAGRSKE